MAPKRKHKLLLRNLSDHLSTGVDGTGIINCGRSGRSTRRTNQIAAANAVDAGEDANVTVMAGTVDNVDELGDEFGNIAAANDQENNNEAKDNDDDDKDHTSR